MAYSCSNSAYQDIEMDETDEVPTKYFLLDVPLCAAWPLIFTSATVQQVQLAALRQRTQLYLDLPATRAKIDRAAALLAIRPRQSAANLRGN